MKCQILSLCLLWTVTATSHAATTTTVERYSGKQIAIQMVADLRTTGSTLIDKDQLALLQQTLEQLEDVGTQSPQLVLQQALQFVNPGVDAANLLNEALSTKFGPAIREAGRCSTGCGSGGG